MSKRLLFITPIFPQNSSEDHVVPFVSQFSQQFEKITDCEIDVISLMYPFTKEKYSLGNINVYPIGSNFKSIFKQFPHLLKAILKGRSLHKRHKYDGVLCFWYRESTLVGKVLCYLLKIKQVVWMHGQDINKDNKYISLLKIPHQQLIMISLQQSDFFFQNHKIRIRKIANVAVSRNLFPSFNEEERPYDIVGIGNLGALKNYALFIDIISLLEPKNYNVIIIGDGEEMKMLKEKCKQFGLSDNINFLGKLTHKEVLDYLNKSKVFLHTSKSEGGATVVQEALYSGCKVVCTIDMESSFEGDHFYFSTDKEQIANQVATLLSKPLEHKRIENFKMEDSIKIIYDSFYND
jgi:glycosyltransferase involved in cell wall biosynthesis